MGDAGASNMSEQAPTAQRQRADPALLPVRKQVISICDALASTVGRWFAVTSGRVEVAAANMDMISDAGML